jgi:hypothetical protein
MTVLLLLVLVLVVVVVAARQGFLRRVTGQVLGGMGW